MPVGVSFYYTLVAMNHVKDMLKRLINPADIVECSQGVIE